MQETKLQLAPSSQYRKNANRCVSADINLIPPTESQNNQSFVNAEIIDKGQIYLDNQMDLTCEEEVKIDEESSHQ
jgi:hypothetical protein